MKNKKRMIMIVLMITIISSAFAERQPIFDRLAKGYYSSDFIKKSLIGKSEKEKVFQQATFVRIEKAYEEKGLKTPFSFEKIQNICSYLEADEIQIRKGDINSLWNTETKNIENFSVTTEYDGMGWVYHDYKNDVHVALYKGNCLNIVWISERYTYTAPEILELSVVDGVENKKTSNVISDTRYIYKTIYVTEEEIYQPRQVGVSYQDQFYPINNSFCVQMWTPIMCPRQQMGGGGYQYIDNSYYSSVVTNYYNNTTNHYYEVPKPDPVDPGGPAPAPGHDDIDPGGPAPAPGHGDEVGRRGSIATGSARVTNKPVNDTQKSFQRSSQQARSGNSQRLSVVQRSTQTQQQRSNQNSNQFQSRSTQSKGTPNPGYTARSGNSQRLSVVQRSTQTQQQRLQQRYTPQQQRSASQKRSDVVQRSTQTQPRSQQQRYNTSQHQQPRSTPAFNRRQEQGSYNTGRSNIGRSSSQSRPQSGGARASRPSNGGGSRGHR